VVVTVPVRALLCAIAVIALIGRGNADTLGPADPPVVARVTITSPAELERFVGLGLDMLEMREGNDLFILTTATEVDRLRADGWVIAIDPQQTQTIQQQQHQQQQLSPQVSPQGFMGGYRTVPEMRALLDAAAAQYPDLAEVFVYGESWERLTGGPTAGHDLFGIRLTNRSRPGPKPTLFLMAAIHARELTTSELALRLIDHLLAGYGEDGDATWLLDEHLIVVVPVVNPDGRVIAEQGYLQRKNTDTTQGPTCTIPSIGVDLNRNADFRWGTVNRPTQSPCSETYPGPTPASEPEIASLQALVRSLFADQRGPGDGDAAPLTTTGVLLTIHSYSNLVMWPWGYTGASAPNAAQLSAIGRKLAGYNGYTPQQSIQLYPTSGTTDDWAYGELGIAAFTFEVGPGSGACGGFFPSFSCLDGGTGGSFWPRNLPAFLYAARIARAPYQLVSGPTPERATAMMLPDGSVDVQVDLDEQRNGGQPVAAAEYYVDLPPWSGGTALPMSAADGAFDAPVETATVRLPPASGRRLLYVRGQDSTGAWGPVRAIHTPDAACAGSGVAPASESFGASGGTGTAAVSIPAGCAWIASTAESWITITSGAEGAGDGVVTYTVAANAGAAGRSGTLIVAGHVVSVTEDGRPLPDLVETSLGNPPAAAIPGARISVRETVRNTGAGAAGASTTRYYLGPSPGRGPGDTLLSPGRRIPALAPSAASTGTIAVTVPATIALGTYSLLACADDLAVVGENDEGNNCVASTTTIVVTRPDLVAVGVDDPPATAVAGSRIFVTDTVRNGAAVGATATTTYYYLSLNRSRDGGDRRLTGSRVVPALGPGATSEARATLTIPSTTPPASYYVIACADDLRRLSETNETNNCAASSQPVQVTPRP
jgi:murein tripeptide amidase MpaA